MASYPTAVKTFTTKSDGAGNKVFASHINDLQDEVTAIEDGLLNGSAPVSCSRATAASLSVAGASTVGSLSVGGASTITGAVTLANSIRYSAEVVVTLSTGDTHNLSVSSAAFLYVVTNSSGSTLTGLAGPVGQQIMVYCAGPVALGLKNSSGSISTNQLLLGSDTSLAAGSAVMFYKSQGVGAKWVRV